MPKPGWDFGVNPGVYHTGSTAPATYTLASTVPVVTTGATSNT